LVPARVALDTTFLLRALSLADDESGLCELLLRELVALKVQIQVPAPVIAEIVRGDVRRSPHTTSGLLVTAFDEKAAVKCGELFPASSLKGAALKFDAMIIACAVRWDAKHIISLDQTLRINATQRGVLGKQPADYLVSDLFTASVVALKPR
jgi:predicted nucleic acid-binding protein